MSKQKAATTNDNTENPIQILKQGTCPTSSLKSNLGFEVGIDESDAIHVRITSNDGGGMFSNEWVAFQDIQKAIADWPEDQGITSMTFRKIFRGKSANTPGFLIAVLCAEGIIEPMGDKKRVHQACDPATFLASVEALRKGSGTAAKKPASKATPKTKEKTSSTAKASTKKVSPEKAKTPAIGSAKTAKTPRKTK